MTFDRPGPVVDTTITSLGGIGTPLATASTELPSLPADFPTHISSKLAWVGSQFTDSTEYVEMLNKEDILEIEDALRHFKSL
jgi:hypothetical protein